MNLATALICGLFFAMLAGVMALISGHSLLESLGFYALFGSLGLVTQAIAGGLSRLIGHGRP